MLASVTILLKGYHWDVSVDFIGQVLIAKIWIATFLELIIDSLEHNQRSTKLYICYLSLQAKAVNPAACNYMYAIHSSTMCARPAWHVAKPRSVVASLLCSVTTLLCCRSYWLNLHTLKKPLQGCIQDFFLDGGVDISACKACQKCCQKYAFHAEKRTTAYLIVLKLHLSSCLSSGL